MPMPESSQAVLKRYLSIPAGRKRLEILDANLTMMVSALMKDEPGQVDIKLPVHAVMLDLVREIRMLRGDLNPQDSTPPTNEEVQSSPVLAVETLPFEENG